jgi:hypothetical protein
MPQKQHPTTREKTSPLARMVALHQLWMSFPPEEKRSYFVAFSFVLNFGVIFAWDLMISRDSFTVRTINLALFYQASAAVFAFSALYLELRQRWCHSRATRLTNEGTGHGQAAQGANISKAKQKPRLQKMPHH